MKILFITAHPYLPQMYGGLQTSADQLCRSLTERGHQVSVLAALMPNGFLGAAARIKMQANKVMFGCKIARDTELGYPVWRTWFPWKVVEYVAGKERPDLIVVLAMQPVRMALAAKRTRIPVLMQLQDVEFSQHGGPFEELGKIPCIANSHFTADKYHNVYGVNPLVIYPFILRDQYQTQPTWQNVTFINPDPRKGLEIAVKVAQLCPEIQFSFIEGWPLSTQERRNLMEKLSVLPNVMLLPSQNDMRAVYGKCKILLAPSVWEEGYGRVATEAQMSGIPVVASTRGGLPEAVGPGGVLLDPENPIEDWVRAVRKLWRDDQYHAVLSASALAHAQRPEMDFVFQIDRYERAFLSGLQERANV